MTTTTILSIFVLACLVSILYRCGGLEKKQEQKKIILRTKEEAVAAVKSLADLGYFKYADPNDLDTLKKDLTHSFEKNPTISTIYFDNPVIPKDYRYYIFDGEAVFEQGGFTDMLKDMSRTFEKIGLKMDVTTHIEDATPKGLNHEMTINGKRYVIFENFEGYGWGEAAQRFAEMLIDQLKLQNKDERLYLISGGNDGTAIFLTDKQFQIIDAYLPDKEWKPLRTKDWCEVFKVKPLYFN